MKTYGKTSRTKEARRRRLKGGALILTSTIITTIITMTVMAKTDPDITTNRKDITLSITQPMSVVYSKDTVPVTTEKEKVEKPTEETTEEPEDLMDAKVLKIQNEATKDGIIEDELAEIEQTETYEYTHQPEVVSAFAAVTDDEPNETVVASTEQSTVEYTYSGGILTASKGVNYGPQGKETYYNLDMSGVVSIMRSMGFDEENYPYWVREDGCKMLGPYIMVAANLGVFPRGSTIECSLGTALVCDTGGFAAGNPTQLDIATTW